MSRVRGSGSKIELSMREALASEGVRLRHQPRGVFGNPDFAHKGAKVAVFCDSSFWHGRNWQIAKGRFKSNRSFWVAKIERNIGRDDTVNLHLKAKGWLVMRFWDDAIKRNPGLCARSVAKAVRKRWGGKPPRRA